MGVYRQDKGVGHGRIEPAIAAGASKLRIGRGFRPRLVAIMVVAVVLLVGPGFIPAQGLSAPAATCTDSNWTKIGTVEGAMHEYSIWRRIQTPEEFLNGDTIMVAVTWVHQADVTMLLQTLEITLRARNYAVPDAPYQTTRTEHFLDGDHASNPCIGIQFDSTVNHLTSPAFVEVRGFASKVLITTGDSATHETSATISTSAAVTGTVTGSYSPIGVGASSSFSITATYGMAKTDTHSSGASVATTETFWAGAAAASIGGGGTAGAFTMLDDFLHPVPGPGGRARCVNNAGDDSEFTVVDSASDETGRIAWVLANQGGDRRYGWYSPLTDEPQSAREVTLTHPILDFQSMLSSTGHCGEFLVPVNQINDDSELIVRTLNLHGIEQENSGASLVTSHAFSANPLVREINLTMTEEPHSQGTPSTESLTIADGDHGTWTNDLGTISYESSWRSYL
jgi:hypothetical protein